MTDTKQILSSQDLKINLVTHQVTHNGTPIKLPELSYRTLVTLLKYAPNTVTIDQLIDEVWQDIEVSPETVTQRIALLRKSLINNSIDNVEYIASIRNQGYRWVQAVQSLNENNNQDNPLKFKISLIVIAVLIVSIIVWQNMSHNNQFIKPAKSNTTKQTLIKDEFLDQAWVYLHKHDLSSNQIALELFRKSLASNPNNTDAMIGISYALSHQVTKFNQPNDLLEEAKDLAQKAIDSNPDNPNGWIALGFVYDARGEIDKAINLYEKAIFINPSDSSTKGSLAYLYSQKGRLFEAMQLNLSVLGSKQPYLNLQIANTLELLGLDSVAEIWYQKADELSPDNVFATHQRTRFYISHDQNSKAKNVAEAAINRGIQRPELYVLLGILDWMNKDKENANFNFQKALEVDASDFEANIWGFIASQNENTSEDDKLKFEESWFQETSNWPNVNIFKALFLAHNNRLEESINSLEKAYSQGYVNYRWLKQLPPFYPLLNNPKFIKVIELMQNDISKQKQQLLNADWLPTSFLDPQNY